MEVKSNINDGSRRCAVHDRYQPAVMHSGWRGDQEEDTHTITSTNSTLLPHLRSAMLRATPHPEGWPVPKSDLSRHPDGKGPRNAVDRQPCTLASSRVCRRRSQSQARGDLETPWLGLEQNEKKRRNGPKSLPLQGSVVSVQTVRGVFVRCVGSVSEDEGRKQDKPQPRDILDSGFSVV